MCYIIRVIVFLSFLDGAQNIYEYCTVRGDPHIVQYIFLIISRKLLLHEQYEERQVLAYELKCFCHVPFHPFFRN